MAYSTQRAVSDGTMTYIDVAIGYQYQSDIAVFYDDLPADPATWSWSSTTSKRIVFTSAIANGVEVMLKRSTTMSKVINVFASGAKFNNASMDTNFQQMLYLTQEAVEGAALTDIFNDVDFHGYKLKNLGTATDDNDAITFGQVKTMSTGAYSAQLAAQAAQAASEAARDLAQKWASQLTTTVDGTSYSAKQYALNAAASATSASSSAGVATAQAGLAANSATAASNSASAAATSAANAAAAAAPATELVDQVNAAVTTANTASANATLAVSSQFPMDCQLDSVVATQLVLSPVGGNRVWIDGTIRALPSGGLTLTPSGTANGYYYVYVYWTGSAVAMEMSATGFTKDALTGIPQKTGDTSRTLVGKCRMNTTTQLYTVRTLSYWNRREKVLTAFGNTTVGSSSALVMNSQDILAWGDQPVKLSCYGNVAAAGAGTWAFMLTYDGAILPNAQVTSQYCPASGTAGGYSLTSAYIPPETGSHAYGIAAWQSGGTIVSNPVYWSITIVFWG